MYDHDYKNLIERNPWLNQSCILAWRGSVAHGTFRDPGMCENSFCDLDLISVVIPDARFFIGLDQWGSRGTKELKDGPWDLVAYDIRKAISLLEKGNPNILSLLYLDGDDYLMTTRAGRMLIESRHLFVGRHVYRAFVGYAKSQIHKMTHCAYQGYMGAKRKQLVEKFGYDTKNAAHTIRLLRMAVEYCMSNGQLTVKRPDRDELLAIKDGQFSKQDIIDEAMELFEKGESLYKVLDLPDKPDHERIDALCCVLVREEHTGRGVV